MLGGVGIDVGVAVVVGSAAGLRSDFDLGAISIWVRFRFRPDLPARIRLDRIGSDRLLPLPMQSVGMGAREARPR